jgi:hypothetical protein
MLEKDPLKRATIMELREDQWLNEGRKTMLKDEELTIID